MARKRKSAAPVSDWSSYRARRRREIYTARRMQLITDLGGRCENCGAIEKLEFDHPHGREWTPRKHDVLTRLKKYAADYAAGNLRLLCSHCNKILLPDRDPWIDRETARELEVPF